MPPTSRRRALTIAIASLLLAGACSSAPGESTTPSASAGSAASSTATGTAPTETASGGSTDAGTAAPGATSVATAPAPAAVIRDGFVAPWAMGALPDGSVLITERNSGKIYQYRTDGGTTPIGTISGARHVGEGGLLGIAIPPDFDVDPVFYVYYTTDDDNRVAAVPYQGDRIGDPKVILSGIPRGRNHNGGRMAFGPDGQLYISTGDAGERSLSQSMDSLGGKILRVTPDGKAAPGNPFGGSRIYSLGHRNVQGLAWDDQKRLYASEFGQDTWDELNRIEPGGNYGWPEVEGKQARQGFIEPLAVWAPADASPSGIAIGPDGAVYMASLRGESVWRIPLTAEGTAGTPTRHLQSTYGRIRDVRFVGDRLWLLTSNLADDKLISVPFPDVGVQAG